MSNKKLKKISIGKIRDVVRDDDIANEIIKNKEPVFSHNKKNFCISANDDELIKIEAALRKCKRVGVFDN